MDPLNSAFSSVDGVLFNHNQTTLVQYPSGKVGDYRIPNSVTSIGAYAFSGSGLTRVYIQGNAPSVGGTYGVFGDNATLYYLPGTVGWGSIFGGRPTELWTLPYPLILNSSLGVRSNQFGFTASWSTNLNMVAEAASDLVNPVWSPVKTNTLTSGSFDFSDPQSAKYSSRFYRIRSL